MRLTLRTLLAYLDDVLEPNAAREIGAKLGESPVAAALVERIRDVLKRRRIGTPDVTGPGSKPNANLVGEYLDNTLIGNDVEDIERICLESDVHLAEVAACHKILTLVLGEPVEIPRSTRERMYALGAVMPSEQAGVKGGNGHAAAIGGGARSGVGEPTTLPEELARPRSKGTIWVAALLLIVFGAWIGLVINDHGLFSFGDADDDSALAWNGADDDRIGPIAADDQDPMDDDAESGLADAAVVVTEVVEPDDTSPMDPLLTDDAINPPPPGDMPEGDAMPPTDVVAVVPEEAVVNVPDVVDDNAPITPPIADDDQPAVAGSSVQILYTSHEDVLLHELHEPEGWFVLPRNSEIRDGQSIACPEPFEAQLLISGARCRIDILGGTRLRSLGLNAAGPFGFEIERGAIVVRHTGMPDDPATSFGLVVDAELLDVELTPGSILAVHVERLPPAGRPEDAVLLPATRVTMFIPQGHCLLTAQTGDGTPFELSPEVNGWLTWQLPSGEFLPQALQSVPAWYTGIGVRTGAARQTARRYEAMFLLGQPVESSIPSVVRHDEPRFAEFAVRTFGLIGDYPLLARAIASDKESAIAAAARELSAWLPRDPENGSRLHEELLRNVRDTSDVEAIEKLLWGYANADAQRPEVSQRLVEWMLHTNPAIRVLAFEHVRRFTGLTQNYHPMNQPRQLEASVSNWREHLRGNGGALVAPGS